MSSIRNQSAEDVEIGTILSSDVEFDGNMFFKQPVIIQGSIKGLLASDNDVFIANEAVIHADIDARRVSVKGLVDGKIIARERLELFRSARVSGTIETVDLVMQSGAILNGSCKMTVPAESGANQNED